MKIRTEGVQAGVLMVSSEGVCHRFVGLDEALYLGKP